MPSESSTEARPRPCWLILPPHDAESVGEEEVRVRYHGHLSLLYSKRVFREIARALS